MKHVILEITPAFTPGEDFKELFPHYFEKVSHIYSTTDRTVIGVVYPRWIKWWDERQEFRASDSEQHAAIESISVDKLEEDTARKLSFSGQLVPR